MEIVFFLGILILMVGFVEFLFFYSLWSGLFLMSLIESLYISLRYEIKIRNCINGVMFMLIIGRIMFNFILNILKFVLIISLLFFKNLIFDEIFYLY